MTRMAQLTGILALLFAASASAKMPYIFNGEAESGWEAVGALMMDGEQYCSATLVAPSVVITAAHCVEGLGGASIEFFVGDNANLPSSGRLFAVQGMHPHPDYDGQALTHDIAVLILAEAILGVEPVAPRLDPLGDVVGKEALFVGFGLTESGSFGVKMSVSMPITKMEEQWLFNADPQKNTCSGDSGGPALMELDGVVTLVGVTSWGDEDCVEFGANSRVDAFASFVVDYLDGVAPPNAPTPSTGTQGPGGDHCEELGWYGDGICDEDCLKPDSDCAGSVPSEPADPAPEPEPIVQPEPDTAVEPEAAPPATAEQTPVPVTAEPTPPTSSDVETTPAQAAQDAGCTTAARGTPASALVLLLGLLRLALLRRAASVPAIHRVSGRG